MKQFKEYILESQKTWQTEIIDIAKQYVIEPNGGEYEKSDIEKMINSKKLDLDLIGYLCEYLAYSVTNKYGDDLAVDEITSKMKSKSRKEAYLKLENYDKDSDKEITDLIIQGLQKGLKKNPNFPE